jgi:RNA 3'-terminal phosphate cyclase (ATP)
MIQIDGSQGEGGGQVLRSSLALSMATGKPFRMVNVRSSRPKPGLMRQHLTCVQAAAQVCGAQVTGAALGSREITFNPGAIKPGAYRFSIGTAGSTTMVMQALLPALLHAGGDSGFDILVDGGTHNGMAPPFEFFKLALLPRLAAMGATVETGMKRHGFYPAGGGTINVRVGKGTKATPLVAESIGDLTERRIYIVNAHIPAEVSRREISALAAALNWADHPSEVLEVTDSACPGNVLMAIVAGESVGEVFSALAERAKSSEEVAREVADQVHEFLRHAAPIGEHLADQLMVPMALGAGGSFVTGPLSLHSTTNIETIDRFLPGAVGTEPVGSGRCVRVTVRGRA